jgi:multidrug efflux pump subunit AcrA (membrane-fusion protein)
MKRVYYNPETGEVTFVAQTVEVTDLYVDVPDNVTVEPGDTVEAGQVIAQPGSSIRAQIREIEQANPITPRALRELALLVDQIVTQLSGNPVNSVGMQKVRAAEAQIAALRSQL